MGVKDWQSYEALEETIRRDTVAVALAIHLSKSQVVKWKETPATDEDFNQSGARNPLDRLATIITTIEKINPKRAYVPIQWLCARFGFMPPVKLPSVEDLNKDVQEALLDWTREFGETCASISAALGDRKVSKQELADIRREIFEDMTAVMALFGLLEGMDK